LLGEYGNYRRAVEYDPWSAEIRLASPSPIARGPNRQFNASPHIAGVLHVHVHFVTTLQWKVR